MSVLIFLDKLSECMQMNKFNITQFILLSSNLTRCADLLLSVVLKVEAIFMEVILMVILKLNLANVVVTAYKSTYDI